MESFVFYRSFADALEDLPAEQFKEVMMALCAYGLDGTMPELEDPTSMAMLKLMKPQIDANQKRREAGRRGADSRWQAMANDSNPMASDSTPMANDSKPCDAMPNVNVKEKDTKVSQKKSSAFHRPTVDEIGAYCVERMNNVDPQRFFDFYEAKGWRVGSQPMKDWKACVRTWEKRDRDGPIRNSGLQHGTDYDAILLQRMRA